MSYDCAEVASQIYLYLDQEELTWWQRMRIRWHLKECPPCADGFAFEEKLIAKVGSDCVDDMPQELEERLLTFIREHADDETVG
ncbi:MAG: zf-HC2 domain-containing protein [Acidimicrobiia bacterium]|nr:zf-HC2 domain-containing protein [Acidimicrobiia bacterium]